VLREGKCWESGNEVLCVFNLANLMASMRRMSNAKNYSRDGTGFFYSDRLGASNSALQLESVNLL